MKEFFYSQAEIVYATSMKLRKDQTVIKLLVEYLNNLH